MIQRFARYFSTGKKTCLFDTLVENKGKMVEFAGNNLIKRRILSSSSVPSGHHQGALALQIKRLNLRRQPHGSNSRYRSWPFEASRKINRGFNRKYEIDKHRKIQKRHQRMLLNFIFKWKGRYHRWLYRNYFTAWVNCKDCCKWSQQVHRAETPQWTDWKVKTHDSSGTFRW